CSKSEDAVAHLSQTNTALEEQLATSREICAGLRKDLGISREIEQEKSADVRAKGESLQLLEAEKEALAEKMGTLQDRVTKLVSQCERLEAESSDLASAERALREENLALKSNIEDIGKDLEMSQAAFQGEHQHALELQREVELLRQREEEHQAYLPSLREARRCLEEELQASRDSCGKLARQNAEMEAELDTTRRRLERSEEHMKASE
ncbi:unnamed protein product, partial [Ostreobium quekettii]